MGIYSIKHKMIKERLENVEYKMDVDVNKITLITEIHCYYQ